jgi:hypothetical protein
MCVFADDGYIAWTQVGGGKKRASTNDGDMDNTKKAKGFDIHTDTTTKDTGECYTYTVSIRHDIYSDHDSFCRL